MPVVSYVLQVRASAPAYAPPHSAEIRLLMYNLMQYSGAVACSNSDMLARMMLQEYFSIVKMCCWQPKAPHIIFKLLRSLTAYRCWRAGVWAQGEGGD